MKYILFDLNLVIHEIFCSCIYVLFFEICYQIYIIKYSLIYIISCITEIGSIEEVRNLITKIKIYIKQPYKNILLFQMH